MRYVRAAVLALGLLSWGYGGPLTQHAAAQASLLGGTAYGDVELGARLYLTRPDDTELARFQEYRDMRQGFIVPAFRGWFDSEDGRTRVELIGRFPGQADQNLLLRGQRLGSFRFELQRDQSPHLYSTNGRLLGTVTERGVLTLPVPRPTAEEYNLAPVIGEVASRWTNDRVALTLAPSANLNSLFHYSRTEKRGDRPMGMAFGSFGNNHREILEPIEHTVHHLRVAPAIRGAGYQLQASYDYSLFENALSAVEADNPLRVLDTPTVGASRGRSALAPSNHAHTLGMQGALTLPLRGRVTTAMSLGRRFQRAPLLPYTINPAINASRLAPLPEHLDGEVRTLMVRVAGSMRPLSTVTLGGRFRHYDLDDRTPTILLSGMVLSDGAVSSLPLETRRYPYTQQTAGADLRWRIAPPLALQLAYGYEAVRRDTETREVGLTKEHTPRVTLDLTPAWWLSLHSTYLRGERRGDGYAETSAAQLPLLRKHIIADRDRERVELAAHVTPLGALSLGASYSLGSNEYPDSRYGRTEDSNRASEVSAHWQPSERLSLTASYMNETFRTGQRSRFRTVAIRDNESWDWLSNTDDDVNTAGLGFNATIIPRKLDVGGNWDRIDVRSQVTTRNPLTPTGGTPHQNESAVAMDYPETSYRFNPVGVFVRYQVNANWQLISNYRQERFESVDFRTNGLQPSAGQDLFMGNDLLDYRASLLSVTVRYSPRIPGVPPVPI
jgi:MtrB/PioB family decaheme-associated outer membrane protein